MALGGSFLCGSFGLIQAWIHISAYTKQGFTHVTFSVSRCKRGMSNTKLVGRWGVRRP